MRNSPTFPTYDTFFWNVLPPSLLPSVARNVTRVCATRGERRIRDATLLIIRADTFRITLNRNLYALHFVTRATRSPYVAKSLLHFPPLIFASNKYFRFNIFDSISAYTKIRSRVSLSSNVILQSKRAMSTEFQFNFPFKTIIIQRKNKLDNICFLFYYYCRGGWTRYSF